MKEQKAEKNKITTKRGHSGFTLIELIVGLAVASVIILGVVFFVSVGTYQYGSSSSEVSVQIESQIALNQLSDMMMEGTEIPKEKVIGDSVVYYYHTLDGREILVFDRENSRLLNCSQTAAEMTDGEGNEIPVDSLISGIEADYQKYLIANRVTDLQIEQKASEIPVIDVALRLQDNQRTRSVSGQYRMRNVQLAVDRQTESDERNPAQSGGLNTGEGGKGE